MTEYLNPTPDELSILATYHGNAREARVIRDRLYAAGMKWCSACEIVKPLDDFSKSGSDHHQAACKSCYAINHARRRCTDYVPVTSPERLSEATARAKARNPELVRARARAAYWNARVVELGG